MKKSPTFFYNLPYESYEKKSSYEVENLIMGEGGRIAGQYINFENPFCHNGSRLADLDGLTYPTKNLKKTQKMEKSCPS